jgi:hypothetical protein
VHALADGNGTTDTRNERKFWFGETVLVGGVYKTGIDVANVYLPRKSGAFDYGTVSPNQNCSSPALSAFVHTSGSDS